MSKNLGEEGSFIHRAKSFERTMQFWMRAVNIYGSYKVCQARVMFVKGEEKKERIWERQHEVAATKVYSLCYDLGGFFLKAAQVIGKPDLAPRAWVEKLVTLCDAAPSTPFEVVKTVLQSELNNDPGELFGRFDPVPIGSASIAQVHRARIKGSSKDVAVKVQHPGVHTLMMTDIHNLKNFASYLQQRDINFDLVSIVKELEKQVEYEFDFSREAESMKKISKFLKETNKGDLPVLVPKPITGMVTRKVLVMEFLEGVSIMRLGEEMSKRNIATHGKLAVKFKTNILKSISKAYGQMILKSGFFHADPHPGNILVNKDAKVALLDYGQVKELPESLRVGLAQLFVSIVLKDAQKIEDSFRELGIRTTAKASDNPHAFRHLAEMLFDTRLPPGVKIATPFGEDSSLHSVPVQSFPEELAIVMRTIQLLRGVSIGMDLDYSCAEDWKPLAEEVLYQTGRLDKIGASSCKPPLLRNKRFGRHSHRRHFTIYK